jgi:hypothetical protein
MDIFYSRSMDALRLQSVVLLRTSNIAFAWKRLRNLSCSAIFFHSITSSGKTSRKNAYLLLSYLSDWLLFWILYKYYVTTNLEKPSK